ncbi:hemicentin-2-like, partial [Myxocyprinus asiaticus]|uniref:hemicentin-2-like n=1 Tax=Myxocyprinus asiaticus TaxID=70543 RepID=UPI0022235BD4
QSIPNHCQIVNYTCITLCSSLLFNVFTVTDVQCPPYQLSPSKVVRYGDSVSVNCSTSVPHDGMGLESSEGGVPLTIDSLVTWRVSNLRQWDIEPICYINYNGEQCLIPIPIIIYKTPGNVSISTIDNTVIEGNQYELQCDIQDVAPVSNLSVKWYKGQTLVNLIKFDDTTETPVNVTATLFITPNRTDDGVQYRCEAELELGPEGPQPPPRVASESLNIAVHYKPQINFCKDWSPNIWSSLGSYPSNSFSVVGNPPPNISWSRGSSSVNVSMLLDKYDSGQYNITAHNEHGSSFCIVNITVEYLPELNCSKSHQIKEKTLFKPPCLIDGFPKPDVFLYKDGKVIQLPYYPTWNDGGWYHLTASNKYGAVHDNFTINILYKPQIHFCKDWSPMIWSSMSSYPSNSFSVVGNPPPNISWSRGSSSVNVSMLLDKYDSGQYNITAHNEHGSSFCIVNITVEYLSELNCSKSHQIKEKTLFKPPCLIDGLPKPDVFLYKDGKVIQLPYYPTWNDVGWYHLTASNKYGAVHDNFTINILYKPQIHFCKDWSPKICSSLSSYPSNSFSVVGNPPPNISWSRGSSSVNVSMLLDKYDSGQYNITARNEHGSSFCIVNITVEYPPELNCSESYQINEKNFFKLPCLADGFPKPDVSVYKDGKLILPSYFLTRHDSGWYNLTASNKYGTVYRNFTINILYAPVLETTPETFVVVEDSSITLECSSTGNPEPEMWWSFNNKSISTERRHRHITFNIQKATSTSAGVYKCIATNRFGRQEKNFIVKIKGNFPIYTVVIGVALVLLILIILFCLYMWRKMKSSGHHQIQAENEMSLLRN